LPRGGISEAHTSPYHRPRRGGAARTNTAILLTWLVLQFAFATACTGNAAVSGDSEEDRARLEIRGSSGTEFSGSCAVGDEEPEEISGRVPKSFTYNLKGRPLDCEISSDGDLRVDLTVGKNVHAVQRISEGDLNLIYENGSIFTVASSSSGSGGQGSSSISQVISSVGTSGQELGNVTSESRNASGFDEVELQGVGNLSIRRTGSESLTVEAEKDVLPKIRTEVENNRLIIGPKTNTTIRTTEPINYELTVKNLNALEVSGSGSVEAESIDTYELAVTISGTGNVKMSGKADSQEIDISGSGSYRAGGLESKEAKIGVGGAGSAIVNVSEALDAEVSGSGSVEYIGDPTVNQDVSGAGRVSKH
jgi:hypothetical protein